MRTVLSVVITLCTAFSLMGEQAVELLSSSESLCEIRLRVPQKSIKKSIYPVFGNEGTHISCEGLPQSAVAYRPQLPYVPLAVIIPAGKKLAGISVEQRGRVVHSGLFPTYYMPHGATSTSKRDDSSAELYYSASDTLSLELVTTQVVSGVTVAYMNYYPVQYSGRMRSVVSYSGADVWITFEPQIHESDQSACYLTNRDCSNYINSDMLSTYTDRVSTSSCDLLILSTEELLAHEGAWSIGALRELRERQGFRVELISLSAIISSASGVDTPQKIRNYLRDAYRERGFSYLLIIGDVQQIPARILTPNSNPLWGAKVEKIPSDLYYQCLDGHYNSNGDTHWGDRYDVNVDILPEFSIGRAPVESVEELENFIYKTLVHEEQNSCEKALIAAEPLGLKGISSTDHMDEIAEGTSSNDYITKGFSSLASTAVVKKYGESAEWYREDMLKWLNSNEYSLVNHLGHGYYNMVMLLKNGDENKLTNKTLPFLYTQACLSGKINNDCIAERLLTSNRYGFWGAVMNAATGKINGEKKGPSQFLDRFFWDAWFSKGKKLVGDMNRYSHEMCVPMKNATDMVHCIYSSNLLGDPTAPIIGSGMTSLQPKNRSIFGTTQIMKRGPKISIRGRDAQIDGEILIYSLKGRLLKREALLCGENEISFPSLGGGIYIVQLRSVKQVVQRRVTSF